MVRFRTSTVHTCNWALWYQVVRYAWMRTCVCHTHALWQWCWGNQQFCAVSKRCFSAYADWLMLRWCGKKPNTQVMGFAWKGQFAIDSHCAIGPFSKGRYAQPYLVQRGHELQQQHVFGNDTTEHIQKCFVDDVLTDPLLWSDNTPRILVRDFAKCSHRTMRDTQPKYT